MRWQRNCNCERAWPARCGAGGALLLELLLLLLLLLLLQMLQMLQMLLLLSR